MSLLVMYENDTLGEVEPPALDDLIASRRIQMFRRSEGWVNVATGPIRGRGGLYDGPERRKKNGTSHVARRKSRDISPAQQEARNKLQQEMAKLQKLGEWEANHLLQDLGIHQLQMEMQSEELRESQKELESFRRAYKELYDSSPVAYFTLDTMGKITDANLTGAVLLGLPRDSLVKKYLSAFVHPNDRNIYGSHWRKVVNTGEIQICEVRLMRMNEPIISVQLLTMSVKDTEGKPAYYRTVISDVTERKRAEEKVREYSAELERSNKELDQLATVISHDLQAPLRVLSAFADRLQQRYSDTLDENGRKYVALIVESAAHMRELIKDLREYSKAGAKTKPFSHVDFNKVFEKTVKHLDVEIKQGRAVITSDKLPTILADESQMAEVFQNLIGNAIKYRSGASVKIHISAEQKTAEWLFRVSDNGIGIDEKQFDRIFEIFQRLHTSEEYSGTGVGLAICKKIIERHGGRIWVESKPGQGSTFLFTLPKRLYDRHS